MSVSVVVYTAIFGGKDQIKEPLNFEEVGLIDYFLITDDTAATSSCYKIIHKDPIYEDITKNARYYKIFGLEEFKNYDVIIWHDANLQIIHNKILEILRFMNPNGIAVFKHSQRNCIYAEAIKCIQLEKDYPNIILRQVLRYFIEGVNPESGLYDTSFVVKQNRILSNDFLKFWWKEIKTRSRRDQLSLPYALKMFKIEPGILQGCRDNNDYSIFFKHSHSSYNFLSLNKPKPFKKWNKIIAIKLIVWLKKINGVQ
ncbi:glycosyltransferase domain-containing protein [Aegicerativicinus sediminis]|uniref:glycosyltransferase domain-containing protein n=1 Tax=Aegicerativicinus sediminis TaxID=2893202 RepID=UPI001E59C24E|nr:glycosyltransferase domain-containing protein [Aegicerativicinus sediminis]